MRPGAAETFAREVGGRPPVQVWGSRGMVSSMHPEASQAALDVLRAGGNAVDAAVALGAVIAVTSHNWAGMAGDSAWLVYSAATGEFTHLDGYGTCPAATTPGRLARHFGLDPRGSPQAFAEEPPGLRDTGVVTSMIPGTPAAWCAAWRRYGSRPFASLLERAAALAEEGLAVNRYLAASLRRCREKLGRFPSSRAVFFKAGGEALGEGDRLVQRDLADTLRRFAADPEGEFSRGPTAQMLAAYCRRAGGTLTADDLDAYRPVWRRPVEGSYRGHPIVTAAPPTAGLHVLQALNVLETLPLAGMGYHTPESLHVLIEALKLALADRRRLAGDPDFVPIDVASLLDKGYAATSARTIEPRVARAVGAARSTEESTTHFVVVDAEGNVVSGTQTIGADFGCGEVAEGTGLVMNDRTWWMALAGSPNTVAPGRRANIGHAPTIVLDGDRRPWIALGSPGGFGIVQYVVQTLVNVIDYDLDIQSAIEAPRFRVDDLERAVSLESRFSTEAVDALRRWGHSVTLHPEWSDRVGGVEAVMIDRRRGHLLGGYDPRRNSLAAGY